MTSRVKTDVSGWSVHVIDSTTLPQHVTVPQCPIEHFDVSKAQGPNNIILSVNAASAGPDSLRGCWKNHLLEFFSLHSATQPLIPKQNQHAWGNWVCKGVSFICPLCQNQGQAMGLWVQITTWAPPLFMAASPLRSMISFPRAIPEQWVFFFHCWNEKRNRVLILLLLSISLMPGYSFLLLSGTRYHFKWYSEGYFQEATHGSLISPSRIIGTYWPYIVITNVGPSSNYSQNNLKILFLFQRDYASKHWRTATIFRVPFSPTPLISYESISWEILLITPINPNLFSQTVYIAI